MDGDGDSCLQAALDYANRGWFVVPLHPVIFSQWDQVNPRCGCRQGSECSHAGKHPVAYLVRNGAKDASRFNKTVERWWQRQPAANVGIVVGPSRLVVLDIDPRNGGDASYLKIKNDVESVGETLVANTGGGGRHIVFADNERKFRSCNPLPGIDILAGLKVMVAAPSVHKSGRRYEWVDPTAPVIEPPQIIVDWAS